MNKVTPFLMYRDQLEQALELYPSVFPSVFPDASVEYVQRAGEEGAR